MPGWPTRCGSEYQVTHDPALPRQALDAGLTALTLDPRQPATRVAVATVYQGLGQNEAAASSCATLLSFQPSNDDAHRILSRVLVAQGKPEQAISELQQALDYRPRSWLNANALARLSTICAACRKRRRSSSIHSSCYPTMRAHI